MDPWILTNDPRLKTTYDSFQLDIYRFYAPLKAMSNIYHYMMMVVIYIILLNRDKPDQLTTGSKQNP